MQSSNVYTLQYLFQISKIICSCLVSCQLKSLPKSCWMALITLLHITHYTPLMHIFTHPLHCYLIRQQYWRAMPELFFFFNAVALWKKERFRARSISYGWCWIKWSSVIFHFVHSRVFYKNGDSEWVDFQHQYLKIILFFLYKKKENFHKISPLQ